MLTLGRHYSYQAVFRLEALRIARPWFAAWSELYHVSCICRPVHVFTGQRCSNRQTSAGYFGSYLSNGNPETPGHAPRACDGYIEVCAPYPFPCGLSFSRVRYIGSATLSPLLSLSASCVPGPAKPRRAMDSNNRLGYFWVPISQPRTVYLSSDSYCMLLLP